VGGEATPFGKLHHIGYVVKSISLTATGFAQSVFAEWDGMIFDDPLQRVRVTFLTLRPGDPQIELVEPSGQDAPVIKYLERHGEGLHHVCYEVVALEEAIASMRSIGALLAKPPKPAVAFGGRKIAWLLTREKLLIELLATK
jgi:methylmalonyl-CoA/ethylmalonyl-CoA epimerase